MPVVTTREVTICSLMACIRERAWGAAMHRCTSDVHCTQYKPHTPLKERCIVREFKTVVQTGRAGDWGGIQIWKHSSNEKP